MWYLLSSLLVSPAKKQALEIQRDTHQRLIKVDQTIEVLQIHCQDFFDDQKLKVLNSCKKDLSRTWAEATILTATK